MFRKFLLCLAVLLFFSSIIFSQFNVGLMIPGEIGGNPIYELVEKGVLEINESGNTFVKIVEGGYNPAKWESLLRSMVVTGKYDLIVTFTEGLPDAITRIAKAFPKQKMVLIDGALTQELPNVYSVAFKDEEMTFLAGIIAGLVTISPDLPGSNSELVVGLIAGDTYPAMKNRMLPGFEKGIKLVAPDSRVIFSIVGSWSDPSKGRELAARQFEESADIILEIAGGSGIGVIEEARNRGKYVLNVDSNLIAYAPGTILASALKHIDTTVKDTITKAASGNLEYGKNVRIGIHEGAIDLTFSDPDYLNYLPESIREIVHAYYVLLKYGLINIGL